MGYPGTWVRDHDTHTTYVETLFLSEESINRKLGFAPKSPVHHTYFPFSHAPGTGIGYQTEGSVDGCDPLILISQSYPTFLPHSDRGNRQERDYRCRENSLSYMQTCFSLLLVTR